MYRTWECLSGLVIDRSKLKMTGRLKLGSKLEPDRRERKKPVPPTQGSGTVRDENSYADRHRQREHS
jgi:hypothetical protein